MGQRERGLYGKFLVARTDGRDGAGEKHYGCDYFVLDLVHDRHAAPALLAYAASCESDYPLLAADLRTKAAAIPNAAPDVAGKIADTHCLQVLESDSAPDLDDTWLFTAEDSSVVYSLEAASDYSKEAFNWLLPRGLVRLITDDRGQRFAFTNG